MHSHGLLYEYGDKNSRLLAHQFKPQVASRLIPQIRDGSNNIVSKLQDVNKVFESFYSYLYKSELPPDRRCMEDFLMAWNSHLLTRKLANDLDRPLELTRSQRLSNLCKVERRQVHMVMGQRFIKKFCGKLAPLLVEMFNESLDTRPSNHFSFT